MVSKARRASRHSRSLHLNCHFYRHVNAMNMNASSDFGSPFFGQLLLFFATRIDGNQGPADRLNPPDQLGLTEINFPAETGTSLMATIMLRKLLNPLSNSCAGKIDKAFAGISQFVQF